MDSFLASVNWEIPSWDLFIYLFFIISVALYGFSLGRERIWVIMVSVYMSLAIAQNLPFINEDLSDKLNLGPVYILRLLVFAVCVFVLFYLFSKMGALAGFAGKASVAHIAIFSVLQVGLLISIILSFLPPDAIDMLSDFTRQVFTSDLARFLWIVAPIGAMLLVKPQEAPEKPEA